VASGPLLVTGGAGYVGSHVVRELLERDERLVILDDLSEGHARSIPEGVELVQAHLGEQDTGAVLDEVFSREPFDGVLHFGGKAYVGESVRDPEKYYSTNVTGGIQLLAAMARHGVPAMIFSSTCATYGVPERIPIDEEHPQRPVSAYGRTKLAFEGALIDFEIAHGVRYASLRYFNAAGAHPSGDLGEDHRPETHLIPLACEAALGRGLVVNVFGSDYDTPDGTCIRDYVHVQDLAFAHIAALDRLREGAASQSYNLGTGRGHSVLEVLEAVGRVSGNRVPHELSGRRPGDPARLVARADRARSELGWTPKFTEIEDAIATAWQFKERFPNGYPES
jgi:UDP-glucose 4-epimerase